MEGRGAEVEAVVVYAEAEGMGGEGQVVFDGGEATVAGVGGVGEVQGPDETGELGDNGGAEQVVEVEAAVAVVVAIAVAVAVDVEDSGLIQVMGYEHGLVDEAGNPGQRVEQVMEAARAGGT